MTIDELTRMLAEQLSELPCNEQFKALESLMWFLESWNSFRQKERS